MQKKVLAEIDEITDHPQTLIKTPCEQIPADIVANQTYNVDGVAGATMTSNAIKGAVRDCLDQAGGSDVFSAPVGHAELAEGEDVERDAQVLEDSESQYVLKAETLDELAELMGVPADNLKKIFTGQCES